MLRPQSSTGGRVKSNASDGKNSRPSSAGSSSKKIGSRPSSAGSSGARALRKLPPKSAWGAAQGGSQASTAGDALPRAMPDVVVGGGIDRFRAATKSLPKSVKGSMGRTDTNGSVGSQGTRSSSGQRKGKINRQDPDFSWTSVLTACSDGDEKELKRLEDLGGLLQVTCNAGNGPMHCGARNGHVAIVKFLLAKRLNPDIPNNRGWTPLHWASMNGHAEVVLTLVKAACNARAADHDGRTPLMWASRHGHVEIVKRLLMAGDDAYREDNEGHTALDQAQDHASLRSVLTALEEVNGSLIDAARRNDINEVGRCLAKGAQVDHFDNVGWTALVWAALNRSVNMINLLIQRGASPSLASSIASRFGNDNPKHTQVQMMLKDMEHVNDKLLQAVKGKDLAGARRALTQHAFVNARDKERLRSALHWSASNGDCPMIDELLKFKANLELTDAYGWRPIHFAVTNGHGEATSMLYVHGDSLKAKTFEGETLLFMAACLDQADLVQMLIASSGNVDERDHEEKTLAHAAARRGMAKALGTLLTCRADPRAVDGNGKTLIRHAIEGGHASSIEALMARPEPLQPVMHDAEVERRLNPNKSGKHKAKAKDGGAQGKKAAEKKREGNSPSSPHSREDVVDDSDASSQSSRQSRQSSRSRGTSASNKSKKSNASLQSGMRARRFAIKDGGKPKRPDSASRRASKLPDNASTIEGGGGSLRRGTLAKRGSEGTPAVPREDNLGALQWGLTPEEAFLVGNFKMQALARKMRESMGTMRLPDLLTEAFLDEVDPETGLAAVSTAICAGHPHLVKVLVSKNAKVDRQNSEGNTALMLAASKNDISGIHALLEEGASAGVKNHNGKSAFDLATSPEVRTLLMSETVRCLNRFPKASLQVLRPVPKETMLSQFRSNVIYHERLRLEGLPPSILDHDLLQAHVLWVLKHLHCPEPDRTEVPTDPITNRAKGIAYVEFHNPAAADQTEAFVREAAKLGVLKDGSMMRLFRERPISRPSSAASSSPSRSKGRTSTVNLKTSFG
eukprot:TRINITY_DN3947_c0_g3_i1.p1 TRINITY_DN3947_c0_g3~~TRINITY_DN3947_c0_g3_i1.p1  ORF type:complete len:1024 (+),score=185.40 TRINITY_DN3947_c0_g3_i1:82-3153(+)